MKPKIRFASLCLVTICLLHLDHSLAQTSVNPAGNITACDVVLNNGPVARATGYGEEHILNGLYSGLAQRYNALTGTISKVRFWARATGTAQNVKVAVYQENVGFPGTLLSQVTVAVPASSSAQQLDAILSAPVAVNGNIILSIEPSTPATNDIWLQHNQEGNASNNYIGNGGNLYLNLVRQGVTWYKDLANGDPSWDYDFMIIPIRTYNIAPAFTFNANNLSVTFNNTTGASTYRWTFGDGGSSTQTSPVHNYAVSGSYQVKLKAFSPDTLCSDSLTQTVVVTNTGISSIDPFFSSVYYDSRSGQISGMLNVDTELFVTDPSGKRIATIIAKRNQEFLYDLSELANGIYFVSNGNHAIKFFKN